MFALFSEQISCCAEGEGKTSTAVSGSTAHVFFAADHWAGGQPGRQLSVLLAGAVRGTAHARRGAATPRIDHCLTDRPTGVCSQLQNSGADTQNIANIG